MAHHPRVSSPGPTAPATGPSLFDQLWHRMSAATNALAQPVATVDHTLARCKRTAVHDFLLTYEEPVDLMRTRSNPVTREGAALASVGWGVAGGSAPNRWCSLQGGDRINFN